MNIKQEKMILDWMRKVHQLEYAHRYQSLRWNQWHKFLGITSFALAALIAFSKQLPSLEKEAFDKLFFVFKSDFFIPFSALLIAVFTGLQTFLKPYEKSEIHKNIGSDYEKIRHRFESVYTENLNDVDFVTKSDIVKKTWDELNAINASSHNFNKGKAKANSFGKYPKELDFIDDFKE
jgi:hypothetical protein